MNSAQQTSKRSAPSPLRGLLAGVAQYGRARLSLFMLEAKTAGIQYGAGVALGAAGLFVAILGYVFLVITAVFGIAALCSWRHAWLVVLAVATLLHLAASGLLMVLALRKFKAGAFEGTLQELKEDQKWLSQPTKKT